MNRNEAQRIDPYFLKVWSVYRFKSKSLGEANVEFLGGHKIKIIRGELILPSSGKKLKAGAILSLPMLSSGDWYQLADPVVIETQDESAGETE